MISASEQTSFGLNRLVVWVGRLISLLMIAAFTMSAIMKLRGGEEVTQGFDHLGIPIQLAVPLAVLELTCVIIYLIPVTSVLGAILLTGYLGGAICTHWRVGDAYYTQVALGILVWIGIYLREPRLRGLIPFRIVHD